MSNFDDGVVDAPLTRERGRTTYQQRQVREELDWGRHDQHDGRSQRS
jgi:hypothetical protein